MSVEFEVIPRREANAIRKPKRPRRAWAPLINALVATTGGAGKAIFVKNEEVSDSDVKYLIVALGRRGKGERLRTQREERDGVEGRLLWVVRDGSRT